MTDTSALQAEVEALCARFPGTPGVCACNLITGEEVAVNEDVSFPTASMIKILVLFELFRACGRGDAALTERLTLREDGRTLGSGLLLHFDAGTQLTLRELAVLMMAISDNTATNLLIDRLGQDRINQAIRAAGMTETELRNRIDFDLLNESNDNLAVTTPHDYVQFLTTLHRGDLLPEPQAAEMLRIMRIQKHTTYPLGKYLPSFNPYDEEFGREAKVWVASKTGGLDGVRTEGGLIGTESAVWAICVCAKDFDSAVSAWNNPGTEFIAQVSRMVFEAWASAGR